MVLSDSCLMGSTTALGRAPYGSTAARQIDRSESSSEEHSPKGVPKESQKESEEFRRVPKESQRQQVEFEPPTWSPSDVQTERKTAVPAVWSIARMTVPDGAPPRRNVVYVASERLAKVRASSMPPYATSPLTPTAPDLLAASVQPQPLPPRAFPRRLSRPSPPHARQ